MWEGPALGRQWPPSLAAGPGSMRNQHEHQPEGGSRYVPPLLLLCGVPVPASLSGGE